MLAWCCGKSTVPAVVCPVGLDAAALGTLVHHLPRLQLKALDELFSGISFGHCPLREQERHQGQLSLCSGGNYVKVPIHMGSVFQITTGHTDLGVNVLLPFVSTVFVDLFFPPGNIMVVAGLTVTSEHCLWEGPPLRVISHSSPLP